MAFHGDSCACTSGGSVDELQTIDHLLPRALVVDVPGEVTLDVGQAEQRLRADVVEVNHAGQAVLHRHGDVALDLFGRPAVRLRDDLDHRRHRVRVGLDVELVIGVQAACDADEGEHGDGGGHAEREGDESGDHALLRYRRAPSAGLRQDYEFVMWHKRQRPLVLQ